VLDEHGRRDDEARHRDEGGFARRQPALLAPLLDEHALLLAEAAALPAAMPGEDAELANLRAALDERLAHLTLTLERLAAAMQAGRSRTPMDQGDRR
jgi:hypothetical protein